jgi:23S rRNA pseudoU1915 N3-methylase RlmH
MKLVARMAMVDIHVTKYPLLRQKKCEDFRYATPINFYMFVMVDHMEPNSPEIVETEAKENVQGIDLDGLQDITQDELDQGYLKRIQRLASKHNAHVVQAINDAQSQGLSHIRIEDPEIPEYIKFLQEHKNKFACIRVDEHCLSWTKYSPNPTDGQEVKQHGTTHMPSTDMPARQDGILSPRRSREEAERMHQHLKDHPYSVVLTIHGMKFVTTNPIQADQAIRCTKSNWRDKEACIRSAMQGRWSIIYQPFQRSGGWLSKMSVTTLPSSYGSLSRKTEEEAEIMIQHLKTNPYSRIVIHYQGRQWFIAMISTHVPCDESPIQVLYSDGDTKCWKNADECLDDAMTGRWAFLLP